MTTLSEINLNTSVHGALLLLLILAAIAASYFAYRKTIPPVARPWRIFLTALRAMSLTLILLLLFDPILSLTRRKQETPVVAVLVDNSASMGLVDEKVDRKEELKRVLADPLFANADRKVQLQYYEFSHTLSEKNDFAPDSLTLSGDGTDIQRALEILNEKMAERYFASVILLTDGADNLGENPARFVQDYPVPIYPVAIGDPSEQKDVVLSNFVTNEIVYAGNKVPVDVYIRSNGFNGNRLPINLVQGNRTIDTQTVTLSGSGMEQKVRLHFTPEEEGLVKYEIKLPILQDELTRANNTKSFYTKVLKNKLRLCIISGAPGPDFSFLKRALQSDENIEISAYVGNRKGAFYQGATLPSQEELEKFDCFILQNYPQKNSSTGPMNQLKRAFAKGKPMLLLNGKHTDFNKLWSLKDFLPFATKPAQNQEHTVSIKVLPQGAHHPVLRIYEDDLENQDSWAELPPVFSNIRSVRLHEGATSLAAANPNRAQVARAFTVPFLSVYDTGKRKSIALLAYGTWRWDLLMHGVGKKNRNYLTFLKNCVRWLTTKDESKLVRISSNKEIYRSGEEVEFTAQVYFEDYQPVDGAEVTVQVPGPDETQDLTLVNIGDGRYVGNFQVLSGGDYNFTGTAYQQGRVLGRDTGRFSVEEFSLEFQNTRMNEPLLRRIAEESGGQFYLSSDLATLGKNLSFPKKYIVLKSEWEIWTQPAVLIACLVLLGLEWLIRKRKGML